MKLTLPYPPSNNTYYRNFRGHTVISAKGRQYKADVGILLAECGSFGDIPLEIDIKLYPPDRRVRDIDNCMKAIFDSLKDRVFDDDSQICRMTVERFEKVQGGQAVITIKPYVK